MLTSFNSFTSVTSFKIGMFIPWLSDHCPVMSTISLCVNKNPLVKDVSFDKCLPRYKWTEKSKEIFCEGLGSDQIQIKIRSLLLDESITAVQLAEEITKLLSNNARLCNIRQIKPKIVQIIKTNHGLTVNVGNKKMK